MVNGAPAWGAATSTPLRVTMRALPVGQVIRYCGLP